MPINDCRRVTFVFQFIIFYLKIIDMWNKKFLSHFQHRHSTDDGAYFLEYEQILRI